MLPGETVKSFDRIDSSAKGYANLAHYVAAKHGVLGLVKTLAIELGSL